MQRNCGSDDLAIRIPALGFVQPRCDRRRCDPSGQMRHLVCPLMRVPSTFRDPAMSDSQPIPGPNQPPRAEPLQPDRPARGDKSESPPGDIVVASDVDSVKLRKEQSEAALSNVRNGYGGLVE